MATINQIPMTIMGNIVKDLEPKRTAGGKTVITFRVAQTSSFVQRDWQTETGEKRSSFELNADDIGTSIRYATVQIAKANEFTAAQPTQPAQPVQQAKDDPWSDEVQDHFAEPQEPAF